MGADARYSGVLSSIYVGENVDKICTVLSRTRFSPPARFSHPRIYTVSTANSSNSSETGEPFFA